MKKWLSYYQSYMVRPILYKVVARSAIAVAVLLLWNRYVNTGGQLSLGRDGSRAYYKDLRVEVKPFLQDSTIETTGAGDTFGGCCLHHVLKYGLDNLDEEKLTEMLTFANAAASIVTTRKGALRVMPEVEEVEAFIKSRA